MKSQHYRSKSLSPLLVVRSLPVLLLVSPALFRRNRSKVTRDDAFRDLFLVLQTLFEHAAMMKPAWHQAWQEKDDDGLAVKYCFGNASATDAAVNMRFASRLLHRYRWKSVVDPLFGSVDDDAWRAFQDTAGSMSFALIDTAEAHTERLLGDERDWINAAVEQFDDATRRRRQGQQSNTLASQQVAEGVYLPIYIAIQLSDRLIERMRYEAEQAK